ncbi:MAG: hypothetical protein ACOX5J_15475 [Candidatus Hydrogenedentales bacterium]|jgi:hypothetical protein
MGVYRHCMCVAVVLLGEIAAASVLAASSPEVLPVHQEAVRSFLKAIRTDYDAPVISKPKWGKIGPLPSIALRIGSGGPLMELDAKKGTVCFFSESAPPIAGSGAQEPLDTVMSADEAFDLAYPVLEQYALPLAREHYSVVPSSLFESTAGQGRWEVRKELRYRGMESVKSYVEILVRAHTKRVEFVAYHPPVEPSSPEHEISKLEAIERAKATLLKPDEFPLRNIVVADPAGVTKVIGMPPVYRDLRPEQHPYRSRFFWSVPFTAETADAEMRVWEMVASRVLIDMQTGKEISELTPAD